jgi:hypothetical protein
MSDHTGHAHGHHHWRTAFFALAAGVAIAIGLLARRRDRIAPDSRPFDWAESGLDVPAATDETVAESETDDLEVASFVEPTVTTNGFDHEAVTGEHLVTDWDAVTEEHPVAEALTVEHEAVPLESAPELVMAWPEDEVAVEDDLAGVAVEDDLAGEPVTVETDAFELEAVEAETVDIDAVEAEAAVEDEHEYEDEDDQEDEHMEERPAAPVVDLPPGRVRRLIGSSAAVLALGLTLGAGVVVTSAVAGDTSGSPATDSATGVAGPANGAPIVDPGSATDTTGTDAATTTDATTTTDTTTTTTDTTGGATSTDPTTTGTDGTPTSTDPSATATDPATGAPVTQNATGGDQAQRGTDNPSAPRPGSGPDQATPAAPKTPAPSHPLTSASPASVPAPASTDTAAATAQPTFAQATTPAAQAALLALPSQFRFYVRASRIQALPKLRRVDNKTMIRLIVTAQRRHVAWPVLAAVAKQESNLGRNKGSLAARRLTDAQFAQYAVDANRNGVVSRSDPADALSALAGFLHAHGATGKTHNPRSSQHALRLYWSSKARAQRTVALAAFYGALGVGGMQRGLQWDASRLQRRVLRDHRVSIYAGGRSDIRDGRIDTRVLMTIEYLANATGRVRVSSLVSGHSLFTSSGQVSANVYGRAVDVSAVGGQKVAGHQGPGTVTDRTVRLLLMLPKSVRPRQVISLMDLDGPTGNSGSFALPTQTKSIHIGY